MSVDDALSFWKSLENVAGAGAKVHLSGGEPFGDWPRLLATLQVAQGQGLKAYEVETNAFWCTDPDKVYECCQGLDQVGLGRLVVSCDLYHQQHIPFERVKLLADTAAQVLGPGRVRIRWRDFFANPVDISDLDEQQRSQAYRNAWHTHHDRLTGRAAMHLAPLLELHQAETFAGQNCRKTILAGRHVHIDPSGNVFPGVCAGLVVGNARQNSLQHLWDRLVNTEDEILHTLITQGPYGLLPTAEQMGYQPSQVGFADKCHLCTELRRFFFAAGKFWPTIGPKQCYYED